MDNMIAMLAQVGCEEMAGAEEYEAEQEMNDPYAGVNSCDALRIIDGVVEEGFEDAVGMSECMEALAEKGML